MGQHSDTQAEDDMVATNADSPIPATQFSEQPLPEQAVADPGTSHGGYAVPEDPVDAVASVDLATPCEICPNALDCVDGSADTGPAGELATSVSLPDTVLAEPEQVSENRVDSCLSSDPLSTSTESSPPPEQCEGIEAVAPDGTAHEYINQDSEGMKTAGPTEETAISDQDNPYPDLYAQTTNHPSDHEVVEAREREDASPERADEAPSQ
jgi:hypothetical protein